MKSAGACARLQTAVVCLGIVAAVGLVFGRTVRHGFIALDDAAYVTQNWHVQRGLSLETWRWAWTTPAASNWHPLTWLIHAANWQVFGPWAGGHHLASVALHALNAVLVFLVVQRSLWLAEPMAKSRAAERAAALAVALLFALHPTRAESVAWVSELKDVLCGLAWWMSLAAYLRYGADGGWAWYWAAWLGLACALLAKPMAVTLPAVFLLCDDWPLGRMSDARRCGRLLVEKLPFVLLVIVSAALTVWAQQAGGAIVAFRALPLELRGIQAVQAYGQYLLATFWPSHLAIYYPLDRVRLAADGLWQWETWGGLALLVTITAVAWWQRARRPWLMFGWLWFVGTLVPVIGLVKVGDQSHADRYLYLPQVGLWWALVATLWDLARTHRLAGYVAAGFVSVMMATLTVLTYRQVGTWQDTGTVARQALAAVPDNYVAHTLLGVAANEGLRSATGESAEAHFVKAIELEPGYYFARLQLARMQYERGAISEAESNFRQIVQQQPRFAPAYAALGAVFVRQDRLDEAADVLSKAVKLEPTDGQLALNRAQVLRALGRRQEAAAEFLRAVELERSLRGARLDAAEQLLSAGDAGAAEKIAVRAWSEFNRARATGTATAAMRIEEARIFALLAEACGAQGQLDQASGWWVRANALSPQDSRIANNLAWLLATAAGRDQATRQWALALAEQACRQAGEPSASLLDTLAAAQAANGRFADAALTAERAIEQAKAAGDIATAAEIRERLARYTRGEAYVEP